MTMLRTGLLTLLLLLAAASTSAQKVYRCGPDGREYSQLPCKEGRAVDVDDPRSQAQQRDGQQVTDSQKRLAQQLEAERRQRDGALKVQGAAGIQPRAAAPSAQPASSASKGKRQAQGDPTSPVPARVTTAGAKKAAS